MCKRAFCCRKTVPQLPKNLLEAEFFGYEEGSFTGASKGGKAGVFEMAHKRELYFLTEIGENAS